MKPTSLLCATTLAGVLLALAGCAGPAVRPAAAPQPAKQAETPPAPEPARPTPPAQTLTQELLYETLLAEIALQRGEAALATRAYLDLLERTQDYRVAERATQVALQSRLPAEALAAAQRWLALEPDSIAARQTVAAILVTQGRLAEARVHLTRLLAAEGVHLGQGFMHLNNLLARHGNKEEVLALVEELAQPYPQVPEAHFAVARAAFAAGKGERALAALDAALRLRPDWEGAAQFKAQLLEARSADEAAAFFRDYLARQPKAREMRLAYARFLVRQKQYGLARAEFQKLVQDFPGNAEVPFAVGLLSLQMGELKVAEQYLKDALAAGFRDEDTVRYYLGQIAEEDKRFEEARQWYLQVGGEQAFNARLRHAVVLAKEGRIDEARAQLARLTPENNQQRVQIWQTEAQILRDARRYREAFDVLTRALEKLPNHPDLLYDQAMAAEKNRPPRRAGSKPAQTHPDQTRSCPCLQRPGLYLCRSGHPPARSAQASGTGPGAGTGRPIHPRQHGLAPLPPAGVRQGHRLPAAGADPAGGCGNRRPSGGGALGKWQTGGGGTGLGGSRPHQPRQRNPHRNDAPAKRGTLRREPNPPGPALSPRFAGRLRGDAPRSPSVGRRWGKLSTSWGG
jgi:tetratricopeptide (TPR) repeat protein